MAASVKAYGKVNPIDQANHDATRRRRKRIAIISLSTVALAAIVAVIAVTATRHDKDGSGSGSGGGGPGSLSTSVKVVCNATVYPKSCFSTLSAMANSTDEPLDPVKLFDFAVQVAVTELSAAALHFRELGAGVPMDNMTASTMDGCAELLDLAVDLLNDTAGTPANMSSGAVVDDFKTWLSAAITYQDTCIENMNTTSPAFAAKIRAYLQNSTEFTSNSLAILTQIADFFGSVNLGRRRLLEYSDDDGMPRWLSAGDRRLLQTGDPRASADIVVAKDGSGKYKTIKAALNAVPDKRTKRTVIYVKKGVYDEVVTVEKNSWNVMMVGDGMDATIITGKLNFVDGTPTFKTATLAVNGKGFIARDMGFRNTAGPAKHQAVALMSKSDMSVFYRCRIDAYQDTLYTSSLRQFYRECDVYGTVDFIFGNAAAVLQACNILPRVPMEGQWLTLTAQGKTDPNQNTGISVHRCTVKAWGDLSGVNVYLGRPWKAYSTTVFMRSAMGSFVNPAGWMAWTGDSAPSTIFYGEYQNSGAGASTKKRVKWKGVYSSMTQNQASSFTVSSLLNGNSWIRGAGVPFIAGL